MLLQIYKFFSLMGQKKQRPNEAISFKDSTLFRFWSPKQSLRFFLDKTLLFVCDFDFSLNMLEKIGLPAKPSLRGNNWVVDATHCQGCSSQFTFINRKVSFCLSLLSLISIPWYPYAISLELVLLWSNFGTGDCNQVYIVDGFMGWAIVCLFCWFLSDPCFRNCLFWVLMTVH